MAARRARVLALRATGATFEQIGRVTGQSAKAAAVDFARALGEQQRLQAQEAPLRPALDLMKLDELERVVRGVLASAQGLVDEVTGQRAGGDRSSAPRSRG